MKTVTIRQITLGEGRPRICVPIVGKTAEAILGAAKDIAAIAGRGADLCEWRVDWYEDVFHTAALRQTAQQLREVLGDMPILATFRTAGEGGVRPCSVEDYANLIKELCGLPEIDLADIELMTGDAQVREMVDCAHRMGKTVILSNHDFRATPAGEELVSRLARMEALGADICKIAVMPASPRDVLTLMTATAERYARTNTPLITMSMGSLGMVSRISGALTGSCLTFGSLAQSSAPGQIPAETLQGILETLG